jgi:CBS domain-containing protein
MEPDPFENILLRTRAREIATPVDNLTRVESTRPLKDVLQLLKEKKIQSVPVYEGDNTRSINGFVDVLDVTSYALSLWREYERSFYPRTETKFSQSSPSNIFLNTPVGDLINYSGRNGLIYINEDADLIETIKLMDRQRSRARRLALRTGDGLFSGIICQSDLAKFLNRNMDQFKLAEQKLRDLNLVNPCIMVRHDVPMYNAISMLADTKVSGLALVDWELNIIANFSCSDLKGFLPDAFDSFWGTTLDFLRQGTATRSLMPPRTCTPETKLRDLFNLMTGDETNPLHRVFITTSGNTKRLEGICTLTDAITLVAESLTVQPQTAKEEFKQGIRGPVPGRTITVD